MLNLGNSACADDANLQSLHPHPTTDNKLVLVWLEPITDWF